MTKTFQQKYINTISKLFGQMIRFGRNAMLKKFVMPTSQKKVFKFQKKQFIHHDNWYNSLTPTTSNPPTGISEAGKNVARTNILHNCVNMYAAPAWTHFQKALYSALKHREETNLIKLFTD